MKKSFIFFVKNKQKQRFWTIFTHVRNYLLIVIKLRKIPRSNWPLFQNQTTEIEIGDKSTNFLAEKTCQTTQLSKREKRPKVSHNVNTYRNIQIGPTKTAPLLITTIEMKVFWTEIKDIESASRLLNRNFVNKRGSDLSKEVLWVSVGQRAVELRAVKVEGQKKFY